MLISTLRTKPAPHVKYSITIRTEGRNNVCIIKKTIIMRNAHGTIAIGMFHRDIKSWQCGISNAALN